MTPPERWRGVLERLQPLVDSAPAGSHLFLEARSDRRDTEIGKTRRSITVSHAGLAFFWADRPARRLYVASPTPAEAVERVRAFVLGQTDAARGRREADLTEELWVEPVPPAPIEAPAGLSSNDPARKTGVSSRQWVCILRPGQSPVGDLRQGWRRRLEYGAAGRIIRLDRSSAGNAPALPDGDEIRARLERLAHTQNPPDGPRAVVFAPGTAGVLAHELVGHALEADAVEFNGPPLAGPGEPIARETLTIADDPRRGRMAWRIDDEGSPATRVDLIAGGRVAGTLVDLAHAREGRPSTGHGRRASFREPTLPRMGCTFIERGADEPAAIVRGTRDGVYVRRLDVGHTDTAAGAATFRVSEADRVEQGRLTYPLSPFVLRVTAVELLQGIDAIANDLAFDTCVGTCVRLGQPVATSVGAPTIRLGMTRLLSRKF